jgi:hypothetical protein
MTSFVNAFAVRLDCADYPGGENCRIFLPLQSPLGTYEGLEFHPIGSWSVTFLCLRHGRPSLRGDGDVVLDACSPPLPDFYAVDAVCGQENCGKRHSFFSAGMPSGEAVRDLLLRRKPTIGCNGHDLLWKDNQIEVTQLSPSPHLP